MTVKQMLGRQGDGINVLKELLTSIQNPKAIIEAHETYRKQIALTEDQEAKAAEAQRFIAQHQAMIADIEKRENALATSQAGHESAVASFKTISQAEWKKLQDWQTEINAKSIQQEEVDKKNKAEQVIIDSDRLTINSLKAELEKQAKKVAEDRKQVNSDKTETDALMLKNKEDRTKLDDIARKGKEKRQKAIKELAELED